MNSDLVVMPQMSIESVIARRNLMVEFVQSAMKETVDFGKIPGTNKNTLLKPGAEKLNTLFGLTPRFVDIKTTEDWTGAEHGGEPFFYYWQKCQLLRDGVVIGEGDGSCNSWEKKYRYRAAERVCPVCGKPAIIKGKQEYGGGWLCFQRKDGCGAKFADDAPEIVGQQVGQVANPDIFDQTNTLLKMAQKRALIAATLIAVNASEFFTQDVENWTIDGEVKVVEQPTTTQAPPPPPDPAIPEMKLPAGDVVTRTRQQATRPTYNRSNPPLSQVQRNKLQELWRILHPETKDDDIVVADGLNNLFIENYKHSMNDASYEEGAKITGKLLMALRERQTA